MADASGRSELCQKRKLSIRKAQRGAARYLLWVRGDLPSSGAGRLNRLAVAPSRIGDQKANKRSALSPLDKSVPNRQQNSSQHHHAVEIPRQLSLLHSVSHMVGIGNTSCEAKLLPIVLV